MLTRLWYWVSSVVRRFGWWLRASVVHHYVLRLTTGETRAIGRVITHRIIGDHLELVDLEGAIFLVRLDDVSSLRLATTFTASDLQPQRIA